MCVECIEMSMWGGRPMPPSDDARRAFWLQQCPQRGPLLTHMHDRECSEHAPEQCCECKASYITQGATFAPMPPVDIERRLNGDGPVQVTKEPKLATGDLSGPLDGPGRGELTEGQKFYLNIVLSSLGNDR